MKRKPLALTLILALLFFLIVAVPSFQVANATSETFQLVPGAFDLIPLVELQKGDRLEGSFIISNLGPYRYWLNLSQEKTYWITVYFCDPSQQVVLNYTHTSGGSFNFTALYSGDYALSIYCSGSEFLQGAKIPELTIDYAVIFSTTPPKISLLSPLTQTYNDSIVSLAFTVDRPVNWTAYSLDGLQNVTITGNTTLTWLSNGDHNIVIYGNDTRGNVGASETIHFTVNSPTPLILAAAVVVVVVIICIGLLFYFKKRRHQAEAH